MTQASRQCYARRRLRQGENEISVNVEINVEIKRKGYLIGSPNSFKIECPLLDSNQRNLSRVKRALYQLS